MKKIIIILASFVTIILAAAIIIPILYEDEIRELAEATIDDNIEAEVYFDPAKFSLTLLRSFPNPTATIGDFGIVGVNSFEGDTLLSVGQFGITIDLFSLFGDSYRIKSIKLKDPRINIITLRSGEANYEIAAATEDAEESKEENVSAFSIGIDQWSITNGFVSYMDKSINTELTLVGLEHQGSGNISLDVYDLKTFTAINQVNVSYIGTQYFSGQSLSADATLNIDLQQLKFTIKENEIKINDFPISFDGFVSMPTEDINIDIAFASTNSSIKSLYSLIPGAFTEDYGTIKASGDMSFSGWVKGIYNDNSMPAYQLQLEAEDGLISYSDLPKPIENINIDMKVNCADGNIDNTSIDIRKFEMDIGSNPIHGSVLVKNLIDYDLKANVNAELDLAELNSIFPIEGMDMRGLFSLNVMAEGTYDSVHNVIPIIDAAMKLEDGYIKSSEFPKALENITFNSMIDAPSGRMQDVVIAVEGFKMQMEGEELRTDMTIKNLVDYQWDIDAAGSLDLEVISELYPVEGMSYSGNLSADIKTSGKYSDVEAEKYDRFSTSGEMVLKGFSLSTADLPQGMKISSSKVIMDPKQIKIESFNGTIGQSDLQISGKISNYLEYIFQEIALLKGTMSLNSRVLNLNEFMYGEEANETSVTEEDTISLQAVAIPRNIDFEFNSSIDRIIYDNLNLDDAKGLLTVRDGVLDMSDLSFNLLGGTVVMNGQYNTQIPETPSFDYQLNVQKLSISQAYSSFSTIQAFAPMAQMMNGNFSSNFSINGKLTDDLTPIYESINGNGLVQIAEASMKESKLVSGIAGYVKSDLGSNQLSLKDVIMKVNIDNGRAHVSPFEIQMGAQKATINGSIGIDGSLDYKVNTEIEAGVVGQQINQLLSTLQGNQSATASSKIKLHFNVGGTYDNPKINLAGTTSQDGSTATVQQRVKNEVKNEVQQQVDSVKMETESKIKEETQKLMEATEEDIQTQVDTLINDITKDLEGEAGKIIGEELDSTTNELKESLKNIFKKKKKKN